MKSRLREIRLLYQREMRSALRERNIVINSLILPLALYPALLWLVASGVTFVVGQSELSESRIVLGQLPSEHEDLRNFLTSEDGIVLTESEAPIDDVDAGRIDLFLNFREAGETTLEVELVHDGSRDRSNTARARVEEYLNRYRDRYLLRLAAGRGLSAAQVQQFWIEQQNMASEGDMERFVLGLIVPVFMIVMLAVGGMYPAIDSTAGERENATWETLMTLGVDRRNVLISKYLYVSTMSFAAGMLNLIGMTLAFRTFLGSLLGGAVDDAGLSLPLDAVPVIIIGAALLALFIAAGMMILASFARTFKEGQSLVGPFYVAVFLPVLFLQAPGLEFNWTLALIPVVNVTMMFREAFSGNYQWTLIGMTIAVEAATIGAMLLLAQRILQYEDFLIGSYSGNLSRFVKERLFGRRVT